MLSRRTFEKLARTRERGLISLYLPTIERGQEIQQNPIRLKNLVTEAEERGRDLGLSDREVNRRLAPARDLVSNALFWRHQAQGLALFCSEAGCSVQRLPFATEELVFVGDRFCVRPLLPAVSQGRIYYLLALSQNSVRMYECGVESIREIDLYDIPRSLRDAVGYDFEQKSLQFHSGDGRAVFHGHNRQQDKSEQELEEYFRAVDRGVCRLLADSHAPVVIAAVDYLIPVYTRVSNYPLISESNLTGNPERMRPEELHAQTLALAAPYLEEPRQRDLWVLSESAHSEKATSGILHVLPAARNAQVAALFAVSDGPVWGRLGERENEITLHAEREPGDDDLIDLAIAHTVANGGVVHVATPSELPGGVPVAAILRY